MDRNELDQEELEQLRRDNETLRSENEDLKWKVSFFSTEHRFAAKAAGLIFLGPRLAESIRRWMLRATRSNPLPLEETSALGAAIIRRMLAVGLIGFLVPTVPLVWQNLLIRDQNRYFREQTEEIRKQIALQEEQSDLGRRASLTEVVFDGKARGLSMRTREEALEALVALDNKLIDRGVLSDEFVDLKGLDFSCEVAGAPDCAALRRSWLPRTDFSGAKLQGADFGYSDLRESSFVRADLKHANFMGAQLEGAALRENLPTSLHVDLNVGSFRSYSVSGRMGLTEVAFEELRRIYLAPTPERRPRESLISREFALERASISSDLTLFVNSITGAANVEGTIFNHRASPDQYLQKIDHFTRFPMGVIQFSGDVANQLETLKRLDQIQLLADKVFGRFRINVDIAFGTKDMIMCSSRESIGFVRGTLDSYEKLSGNEQERLLKKHCAPRRLRNRGGVLFP